MQSLFEKLGGIGAVGAAVDRFYGEVGAVAETVRNDVLGR
jgi:truncated hemoglobin YjbI